MQTQLKFEFFMHIFQSTFFDFCKHSWAINTFHTGGSQSVFFLKSQAFCTKILFSPIFESERKVLISIKFYVLDIDKIFSIREKINLKIYSARVAQTIPWYVSWSVFFFFLYQLFLIEVKILNK